MRSGQKLSTFAPQRYFGFWKRGVFDVESIYEDVGVELQKMTLISQIFSSSRGETDRQSQTDKQTDRG